MRFYLMFGVSIFLTLYSLSVFWVAPVTLQLLYYGGTELWWGPVWFKPVAWFTVIGFISIIVHRKKIQFGLSGISLLLLVFLFWISSKDAIRSVEIASIYTSNYFKIIISYLIFYNLSKCDSYKFSRIFLWANIVGVLYLLKSIFYEFFLSATHRVDVSVGQGGGANYIAMVLAMVLPFCIFNFQSTNNFEKRISKFLFVLIIIGIIATGSRAGFLCLLLVLLYVFFVIESTNKFKYIVFLIVSILIISPLIPDYYYERMESIGNYEGDSSASNRILEWSAAVELFMDNPISGIGPNNFYLVSQEYTNVYSSEVFQGKKVGLVTHNLYLQLLAEAGFLGLLLFLFPLCQLFLRSKKVIGGLSLGQARTLHSLVLGILVFCLCAVFGSILTRDIFYWYLAVSHGFLDSLGDHRTFVTTSDHV